MSAPRYILAFAPVIASVPAIAQDTLSTLLDTATSVSVLSARDLERRAALTTSRSTPSLMVTKDFRV